MATRRSHTKLRRGWWVKGGPLFILGWAEVYVLKAETQQSVSNHALQQVSHIHIPRQTKGNKCN
jgi:hypothetical protein